MTEATPINVYNTEKLLRWASRRARDIGDKFHFKRQGEYFDKDLRHYIEVADSVMEKLSRRDTDPCEDWCLLKSALHIVLITKDLAKQAIGVTDTDTYDSIALDFITASSALFWLYEFTEQRKLRRWREQNAWMWEEKTNGTEKAGND